MAVEAKAANVARILRNAPIHLTSQLPVVVNPAAPQSDSDADSDSDSDSGAGAGAGSKEDDKPAPPEPVLQPAMREAFEQSLLYARTEFLREKVRGAVFTEAPQWTHAQLESGDLLVAIKRGRVDSRTAATAFPEYEQKSAQHNAHFVLGSFSTQFLKALGLFSAGPALLFNQPQIARIIAMAFAGGAMASAVGNLGLVFAYHKNVALKFKHQNRNQLLGTVDVPNTGPWPFLEQFETLAARPITEADLGDGDLNLQQDLSFFKDFVEQARVARLGGFKGKDGKWKVPLANWAGYFLKQAEDLDKLTPEEVERDLQSAKDMVLALIEEDTREGQRRTEAGLNRAMHGNLGLNDHALFMTDSGEDDGISDSGDEDNLYVDVVVDSEEGASDVDDDAWLDEDDASDESTTDEIVSDPDTEEGLPIEN